MTRVADSKTLIRNLKSRLRADGITYKALAKRLGLSEPTVKRDLSRGGFSLELELAVQGTKMDNLMNFWAVIRGAIWPVDLTAQGIVIQKIRGAHPDVEGVTKPTIQMSGFRSSEPDEMGRRMLLSSGNILFPMLIRT